MPLDIDDYEENISEDIEHKIPLEDSLAVQTTWVGDLNKRYTLYQVQQQLFEIPPVYAYTSTEEQIDQQSGSVVKEETLLDVGFLSGISNKPSNGLLQKLKNNGFGEEKKSEDEGITTTTYVEEIESLIWGLSTGAEPIGSLEGDLATIMFTAETIQECTRISDLLDSEGVLDLIELLSEHSSYPLYQRDIPDQGESDGDSDIDESESGDGEDEIYVFQSKFTLEDIEAEEYNLMSVVHDTIDDTHNGIFVGQPETAFIYNMARVTDMPYSEIAAFLHIPEDDIRDRINGASDMVSRCRYTSDKYTSNGSEIEDE